MTKKLYKARWAMPGHPSLGNVSFEANDDEHAKRKANKIAWDLCLTNTPRTITEGGRVVEVINKGKRS